MAKAKSFKLQKGITTKQWGKYALIGLISGIILEGIFMASGVAFIGMVGEILFWVGLLSLVVFIVKLIIDRKKAKENK